MIIEAGDEKIVIFNIAGKVFAIGDVCTHDGGPLEEGELEGFELVCPRHGARFDIRSGAATRFPAFEPTTTYPVRIVAGKIEIGLTAQA